jgi:multicomponent Na+:H+ antiporter subunit G
MNPFSQALILAGASLAMLAGVGLLRFSTPYARFHAAGKASPIAFLLVGLGASLEVGLAGAAELAVAAVALVLTLPAATHLLFRATHRTVESTHLNDDALARAETAATAHQRDGAAINDDVHDVDINDQPDSPT